MLLKEILFKSFKIQSKDLPKYTYAFLLCAIIESTICHAMGITLMKTQYSQTKEVYFYIGDLLFIVVSFIAGIIYCRNEDKYVKYYPILLKFYVFFTTVEITIMLYALIFKDFGSLQSIFDAILDDPSNPKFSNIDHFLAFDLVIFENICYASFLQPVLNECEGTIHSRLFRGDMKQKYSRLTSTICKPFRVIGLLLGLLLTETIKGKFFLQFLIIINIICIVRCVLCLLRFNKYKEIIMMPQKEKNDFSEK